VVGALATAPLRADTLSANAGDAEIAALLYDGLYRVDATGVARPSLALALDDSQALRVRVTLRGDVRFHDGRLLGAADVAASLSRALREPGGWMLGPVKAVRAVGDNVVEIELTRATPELPTLLGTAAGLVTAGGKVRGAGSGAFQLASLDGDAARLTAAAAPLSGRPFLSELTLRAFAARGDAAQAFEVGVAQVARVPPSAFSTAAPRRASTVAESPLVVTGVLLVGRAVSPRVAAALPLGIDRDRLRRQLREPARAAAVLVPPALGGAEGRPRFDAAAAQAEIGREPAKPRLAVLVDKSALSSRPVADRLLLELDHLGIEATLDLVDATTFEQRRATGQFDLALTEVTAPAPDGALAELAAIALVDAAAARELLARVPLGALRSDASPVVAALGPLEARVVPLYHRAVRLQIAVELHNLTLDGLGRPSWADAWWLRVRR
jgi:MarR-like DNA-binding transcriptional regulator SgrR of sgrS sRNA